ncbi:MAG TPA: tyrosine-type recombinase/integrase [Vicinamibacterales bacterium]|nr:tyrosine-type recombinase/integrase [Vicinamibacterales bacterium]
MDREVGHPITNKTDADKEADRIRTAIREGRFRQTAVGGSAAPTNVELTFREFAEEWKAKRGVKLVRPRDNEYRIKKLNAFIVPGPTPVVLGDKRLSDISATDIEAFRDARRATLSPVTVNHDLKLLRKMFNWGIRHHYVQQTPFKVGSISNISLERETPRDWRFGSDDDEAKLLQAANPHLRSIVVALLDTAARLGEILSLQWSDVDLRRRELVIRAEKSKTRTARRVPISSRLAAELEMRRLDPAGHEHSRDAFVFGNELGRKTKSVRTAWKNACALAGVGALRLGDLRHEAGSRFEEAGVSVVFVSKILGHANLSTTSRYLNIHRRGLHSAMRQLEEHRPAVAQALHTSGTNAPADVPPSEGQPSAKAPSIQ